MKKIILLFTIVFVSFVSANAESNTLVIDSLNQNLYKVSNKYTERNIVYRVVKWETLKVYFDNIKSLDAEKTEQLATAKSTIKSLKRKTNEQAEAYKELNEKYDYAIKANDAMEFFTLLIPKRQYNLMMWGLVIGLVAVAVILFVMFKRSHQLTRAANKELKDSKEEFEGYRQRTLRREQEVANSYMKEISKLKSQLGQ